MPDFVLQQRQPGDEEHGVAHGSQDQSKQLAGPSLDFSIAQHCKHRFWATLALAPRQPALESRLPGRSSSRSATKFCGASSILAVLSLKGNKGTCRHSGTQALKAKKQARDHQYKSGNLQGFKTEELPSQDLRT